MYTIICISWPNVIMSFSSSPTAVIFISSCLFSLDWFYPMFDCPFIKTCINIGISILEYWTSLSFFIEVYRLLFPHRRIQSLLPHRRIHTRLFPHQSHLHFCSRFVPLTKGLSRLQASFPLYSRHPKTLLLTHSLTCWRLYSHAFTVYKVSFREIYQSLFLSIDTRQTRT